MFKDNGLVILEPYYPVSDIFVEKGGGGGKADTIVFNTQIDNDYFNVSLSYISHFTQPTKFIFKQRSRCRVKSNVPLLLKNVMCY